MFRTTDRNARLSLFNVPLGRLRRDEGAWVTWPPPRVCGRRRPAWGRARRRRILARGGSGERERPPWRTRRAAPCRPWAVRGEAVTARVGVGVGPSPPGRRCVSPGPSRGLSTKAGAGDGRAPSLRRAAERPPHEARPARRSRSHTLFLTEPKRRTTPRNAPRSPPRTSGSTPS